MTSSSPSVDPRVLEEVEEKNWCGSAKNMARINEKERQDNEDSFSLSSEGSEVLDSDEDV